MDGGGFTETESSHGLTGPRRRPAASIVQASIFQAKRSQHLSGQTFKFASQPGWADSE
jgi:hypothetical protein